MKSTLTTLFLFFSIALFAHRGDFLAIENVEIETSNSSTLIDFDLENIKAISFVEVTIELRINDATIRTLQLPVVGSLAKFKHYQFSVTSSEINTDLDKIQIEIVELFGQKNDWGGWDNPIAEKQVNTLASEFYADAPWRMKKTDALGDLRGIPVHCFLHDADLVPGFGLQVDNINIQLKNATDANFGLVLTYDAMPINDLNALFTCMSENDNALDIKEFELNSFSPSSTQTLDFDIDNDLWDEFVLVNEKYWFFTFTIPPSDLVGFNNIIDILVTIEYSNLTITDDFIGLRVFRSDEDVPTMTDFYRGDTHLHSMYTQNDAEVGLPMCATKEAASLAGQDWITTTDHTSDFDNYGSSIQNNWTRIKNEAATLNLADNSMMFIPGLEVALNNSDDELVHMLAYPNPQQPSAMPFLGDGNGDLTPTSATIDNILISMQSYNGFAYMSHPFATGDELPSVPVDGGIWNLSDNGFPVNGGLFPLDGGSIICNDLNLGSDVLSSTAGTLVKTGIKGGQIWNSRYNLTATGDELDPWDVQGNTTPFSQMDTTSIEFHFRRFRQGQEIVNYINLGLQLKNVDTSYSNWKLYYSAGTDAHGSFNSSNTDDFANVGTITNNAVGKLSTVTYCPNGMGTNGEDVLVALRDGNTTLSDGPIVAIGLSTDGDNSSNEVLMGEDAYLDAFALSNYFINLDYSTTTEFGDVTKINFYLGTEQSELKRNVSFPVATGSATMSFQLDVLLDSILGAGNTPLNEFMYIRTELQSEVDYTGQESEYKTSYDIFHSISNPIWFNYIDYAGISEVPSNFVYSYPNPVIEEIHFVFNEISDYSIDIYDQLGRLVVQASGLEKAKTMNLSFLESGMYYTALRVNGTVQLVKFVKV